jgi:hypothetical protein
MRAFNISKTGDIFERKNRPQPPQKFLTNWWCGSMHFSSYDPLLNTKKQFVKIYEVTFWLIIWLIRSSCGNDIVKSIHAMTINSKFITFVYQNFRNNDILGLYAVGKYSKNLMFSKSHKSRRPPCFLWFFHSKMAIWRVVWSSRCVGDIFPVVIYIRTAIGPHNHTSLSSCHRHEDAHFTIKHVSAHR